MLLVCEGTLHDRLLTSIVPHVFHTVDAFVALGGNEDKTGEISVEKLKMVINEFGLTIDIQVCPRN